MRTVIIVHTIIGTRTSLVLSPPSLCRESRLFVAARRCDIRCGRGRRYGGRKTSPRLRLPRGLPYKALCKFSETDNASCIILQFSTVDLGPLRDNCVPRRRRVRPWRCEGQSRDISCHNRSKGAKQRQTGCRPHLCGYQRASLVLSHRWCTS